MGQLPASIASCCCWHLDVDFYAHAVNCKRASQGRWFARTLVNAVSNVQATPQRSPLFPLFAAEAAASSFELVVAPSSQSIPALASPAIYHAFQAEPLLVSVAFFAYIPFRCSAQVQLDLLLFCEFCFFAHAVYSILHGCCWRR